MTKQLYINGREVELSDVLDYVPDAWNDIVTKLIEDLFSVGWDGNIAQIKEKFGSLRFYIDYGSDEIFKLIDDAEQATTKVCIDCGEPAVATTKGWFTYVCQFHKDIR